MTEADGMETQTETPEATQATVPGPLERPQEGRWLAGVAAGVANRLGIPHWVARLLFFLAFASGGIGFFLYVAGWLLIPAEGEPDSLAQRLARRVEGTQGWLGIGLALIAGAILLNMLPFVDGGLLVPTILLVVGVLLYRNELPRLFNGGTTTTPASPAGEGEGSSPTGVVAVAPRPPRPVRPPHPPSPLPRLTFGFALLANGGLLVADRLSDMIEANWRHYLAITLLVFGLGLLVGSVWGRARWLILVGVFMIPFMIGATVWEYTEIRTDRTVRPTSFEESPMVINQGTGRLVIDLTGLPWNGETFELDAEIGAGEIEVLVPELVGLEVDGEIGMGAFGGNFGGGGLGVDQDINTEGPDGTLAANLEVGLGAINIWMDFDETGEPPIEGGDLFITVAEESSLAETYTTLDGSIDLDLSNLELTEDRNVRVEAPLGDINIVVPEGVSYRIFARSDFGAIDLLGEAERMGGGTVRVDSINQSDPILELDIYTSEGEIIVLTEGQRS